MDSSYNRGGVGQILVEVEERYREKKGDLFIDTTYDPIRHTNLWGKVIQLPIEMGMQPVEQVPVGFPGYGPVRSKGEADESEAHHAIYQIGGVLKYKWMKDIAPEIEIGDKVWFKPQILFDEKNLVEEIQLTGRKKFIFRVPYDLVYCSVREYDISSFEGLEGITEESLGAQFQNKFGVAMPDLDRVETFKEEGKVKLQEFKMIGSWCLLDMITEDWESILIPTFYDQVDLTGKPIPRPKEQWIQKKVAPEVDRMRGVVQHFGTPLNGNVCELKKGMKVAFRPVANFVQEIEGNKYIVCRQSQILAEVE